MGIDATVMCNCFCEGRASEPPVPRDWLEIDSEGYLNLKPEYDSAEFDVKVYDWMETCCPHPGMRAAWEHIANWYGYRLFQQALEKVGWDRFPVLRRELPEVNGGLTDASSSEAALAELEVFRRVGEVGTTIALIDTAAGAILHEYVATYEGVFIMSGRSGLDAGFDPSGFFIRDRETGVERFRAFRFLQTLLDPGSDINGAEPGRILFRSLDTGRSFECQFAVPGRQIPWPDGRMQDDQGRCNFEHPAQLHVDVRPERSADYEFILQPLEIVFRASVEMGNPVRWC